MIFLKTDEEIELMRESNRLVGMTLGEVAKHIKPGLLHCISIILQKSLFAAMGLSLHFSDIMDFLIHCVFRLMRMWFTDFLRNIY